MKCCVCGCETFKQNDVVWPELADEWKLNADERSLINRQQGFACTGCGCSLRVQALAFGIMQFMRLRPPFKESVQRLDFCNTLEINDCGPLHTVLQPYVQFHEHPNIDMMDMSRTAMDGQVDMLARFNAGHFDLVLHSDVLEHVTDPVGALYECRTILRRGGAVIYTVPMLPSRVTRSRKGLSPSFHGGPGKRSSDYLVHTEYGGDAWMDLARAGFEDIRIFNYDPAAVALCGVAP